MFGGKCDVAQEIACLGCVLGGGLHELRYGVVSTEHLQPVPQEHDLDGGCGSDFSSD